MEDIAGLARREAVRTQLSHFHTHVGDVVEQAIAIQQIAAPTFAEASRAAYVEQQFAALGLEGRRRDSLGNVYASVPGTGPGSPVVVSAHSDTVFAAEQELTVRWQNGRIYGPGIADNSLGVAGMLTLARSLSSPGLRPRRDVWFVANVGEEGLGNLRGMRAVVDHFGPATYLVLEGGLLGYVCHEGIGVRRFRITVETPGGHSWGAFGTPSAIHVLGRLIAALDKIELPGQPKTTYNVGVVEGGSTVNTIARRASLLLDLRSAGRQELAALVAEVGRLVDTFAQPDVSLAMETIGDRPAGRLDRETPLVRSAVHALQAVGYEGIEFTAGSTDANIPLSRGYEAVCIGLTRAANTHRPDEYMEQAPIPQGLGQALLLLLAAAGHALEE